MTVERWVRVSILLICRALSPQIFFLWEKKKRARDSRTLESLPRSPPPPPLQRHIASPSLQHTLLVGGTDARQPTKALKGSCDVVVGTPGRVLDFMEKGLLRTSAVRLLVRVTSYYCTIGHERWGQYFPE